ncbi:hypothetical protein ABS764_11490 [Flavobacterium sp. ST-87]|uniref:Outer membrane lipoprotein-sorting protein n=1 Tax=Flavobacterium plantiphilum TaxID=3163297 RepID=A0ABW8XW56_9FLAO
MKQLILILLLTIAFKSSAQNIPYEKLDAISAGISQLQLKVNGLTFNDGKEDYILSFPENNFQLLYSTGKAQRVVYKKKGNTEYLYLTENIDLAKVDVFYHIRYPGAIGVLRMAFPNGIQTHTYINGEYTETKSENYLNFYYEQKGDSGKILLEQLNSMLYSLGLGKKMYIKRETIDDIVDQYVEAFGGTDKIRSIRTIKTVGTTTTQGINIPTTAWAINNKGMRMEMLIQGKINTTVMTTNGGWTLFPAQRQKRPLDADQKTAKEGAEELDLTGDLFEYKEKGNKAILKGKETVNGIENYKISLTRKSGTIVTFFIDANTFLPSQRIIDKNIAGKTVEMVETFGNYKKNSDGYLYASTFHYSPMNIDFTYSKYEVNVPVEETLFDKP